MDGYLLFNFDGTTSIIAADDFVGSSIPENTYIYVFRLKAWFIRLDIACQWHQKQPEDVPKQHRAALLIYS